MVERKPLCDATIPPGLAKAMALRDRKPVRQVHEVIDVAAELPVPLEQHRDWMINSALGQTLDIAL